jgi:hypothetical protein
MKGWPGIMRKWPGTCPWLACSLLVCLAGPALVAGETPAQAIAAFDRFLAAAGPVCERDAAARCVDGAWAFADRNRDQRLSLGELQGVRDGLGAWLKAKEQTIPLAQRRLIQLGLLLVDGIGLPYLIESYDANGDGTISRAELLTDVRLDARPLGQVLLDAQAVDWAALRQRLGPIAATLNGLGVQSQ